MKVTMYTWLTVLEKEENFLDVLVLAQSLRNVLTRHRLTVLTGEKIGISLKYILGHFFDLVQPLRSNSNNIKAYADAIPWNKFILLSPNLIALENADEYFSIDQTSSEQVCDSNDALAIHMFTRHSSNSLAQSNKIQRLYATKFMDAKASEKSKILEAEVIARVSELNPVIAEHYCPKNVSTGKDSYNENWNEDETLADAIAIIGMSCRFPGANNLDEYWNILSQGKYTVRRFPEGRSTFDIPGIQESVAGFLSCPIDEFDADFFGVPTEEAWVVDPQQRLLLEVAWESLEDAGIDAKTLRERSTGVFIGNLLRDYERMIPENERAGISEKTRRLGNSLSAISGRLGHFLGVSGPCLSHEAGCSSGLGTLHLACESILRGECEFAISGGVNIIILPRAYNTAVLSNDFKCKTFDETADGFVSGEAVGTFILKKYKDAVRDGDRIRGVIRGTAMSNDGASLCYGTPNPDAHARTHRLAMQKARVRPQDVEYVETHGTGTQKGDIGEIFGLSEAYGGDRSNPLILGSVKPNIGHGEGAAATASLAKVILALEKKIIPPNIFLNKINPKMDLDSIPGLIPTEPIPWTGESRLAGISSFSLTGSLVHAILQSTPQKFDSKCKTKEENSSFHFIGISAKTPEALEAQCQNYLKFFESNPSLALADVAYAANVCKTHFSHRIGIVASSMKNLVERLKCQNYMRGESGATDLRSKEVKSVHSLKTTENMPADESLESFYSRIGRLYVEGANFNWGDWYGTQQKKVVLPFYPFQKKKYWFQPMNFSPETHN